jgi:hypothetical protein
MTSVATKAVPLAHVTVSAFDVHLWSKPFDPAQFNPQAHFLWSAPLYRDMRSAGVKVDLGSLILFPLKRELEFEVKKDGTKVERNRFWPRYQTALEKLPKGPTTSLGDVREFLWPLRCRPKGLNLTFAGAKTNVAPKVWATIWLWPFGWSSSVQFNITAPLSLDDLQDLAIKFRERAPGPFMLNGNAVPLSGVFKMLADIVRQQVGLPGSLPSDINSMGRYVVAALQLPRGAQLAGNFKRWAAADQLRVIGALRGGKVGVGELQPDGGLDKLLYTPLGAGNMAINDFNEGTMLVLRHWRDRNGKRETNHCLFANLRNFLAVHFALHRFMQYAKNQPELASAVANAKEMLSGLPEEYRNALCLAFKQHYSAG